MSRKLVIKLSIGKVLLRLRVVISYQRGIDFLKHM